MQLRLILCALILASTPKSIWASELIQKSIGNASIVGEGKLSVAFWDVYNATLHAPGGEWNSSRPFALSIKYFRDIRGKDIADRSVQEMRMQGFNDEVRLAAWNAQMKSIFPDVKNGSILSAIFIPGKQTTFYNGNQPIGVIKGDEFSRRFFDIWLSEKTSEPELRKQLLGLL